MAMNNEKLKLKKKNFSLSQKCEQHRLLTKNFTETHDQMSI